MKLRRAEGGNVSFWCPGCKEAHTLNSRWTFTGTDESPTFAPSVLVTTGHFTSNWKAGDECWCTYAKAHPGESFYLCARCHSFVRDGQIQFLGDCSHDLKNQTVPLPDWPEGIAFS